MEPKIEPKKGNAGTGDLFALAPAWDGPHFRLFSGGLNDFYETPPPHAMFMDANEPLACWEYVLSGAIIYKSNVGRYRVETGEALITRRPDPGWMLRPVRDVRVKTLWIQVAGEPAFRIFDYLHLKFGQIQRFPLNSRVVQLARRLVRLMQVQPYRPAHFWSEKTFQWMNAWWQCAIESHRPSAPVRLAAVKPSRLIGQVPQTMKSFAAEIGYSRAYLTRKLTRQWGRSPGQVLREARLENAALLLRTTRLSVGDIALKAGYDTAAGFCRAFARHFHLSPLAYRREHR